MELPPFYGITGKSSVRAAGVSMLAAEVALAQGEQVVQFHLDTSKCDELVQLTSTGRWLGFPLVILYMRVLIYSRHRFVKVGDSFGTQVGYASLQGVVACCVHATIMLLLCFIVCSLGFTPIRGAARSP